MRQRIFETKTWGSSAKNKPVVPEIPLKIRTRSECEGERRPGLKLLKTKFRIASFMLLQLSAITSTGFCLCGLSENINGGPKEFSSWNRACEPSRKSGSEISTTSTSDVSEKGLPNLCGEGLNPSRALPTIQTS